MKTQYFTASSLDGFIAGPEDSLDWLFPLGNVSETSYPTFIREVGALAMGSSTYEGMLRHVVDPTITNPPLRLISVRAVGSGFAELQYQVPRPKADSHASH